MGSYLSDALNQRVYKSTVAGVTRFVYGPSGELLAELGPTTTSYVWLGGEMLGLVRGNQFYASHNDHLGRPEIAGCIQAHTSSIADDLVTQGALQGAKYIGKQATDAGGANDGTCRK